MFSFFRFFCFTLQCFFEVVQTFSVSEEILSFHMNESNERVPHFRKKTNSSNDTSSWKGTLRKKLANYSAGD